ncbi:MAG: translocation/assembly module TamB domain-containing protein [Gammaproteobacteria bacterium]|nr:translocation/assembly module TamB domain-containing protein [Gammaproteobacteria bacterium]
MIGRWLAALLLLLVAVLAGGVLLLTGTSAGARWLAQRAEAFSGGVLALQDVDGSLAGGLRVGRMEIRAGGLAVRVEQLELVLRPSALLRGRLQADRLAAGRVAVDLPPPGPDEPFLMPTLRTPVPLRLRQLAVATLEIRRGDESWTLTGLHASARLRGSQLLLKQARGEFAGLVVQLAGQAELRAPLPLQARLGWSLPAQQLSGAGTVQGNLDELRVAQAIRVPEPVTVLATLHDLATKPRLVASASWASLARELPGLGRVEARAGQLGLSGVLDDWQATLQAQLAGALLPPLAATARAHGNASQVVIEQARMEGASGRLATRGVVDLPAAGAAAGPRLRLDIIAREVDTAAFRPGLDGRLSGRLRLAMAPELPLRLDIVQLQGRLMGRPLAGTGVLSYADGTLGFDRLALRAGPNHLDAHGSIGTRLAGRFAFDAPDLALLWPGLAGRLAGHATLAGTRLRPVVSLQAQARSLVFEGNSVAEAELRLQVDRRQQTDLDLDARGIRSGDQALGDLEARVDGTLDAHRLHAALRGGPVALTLASEGRWDGTTLRHRLEAASITADAAGTWRLAGEPELVLAATQAEVGAHCWEQAPSSLCISRAHWTPCEAVLAAGLRELDLARFNRWLGEDLAVTGRAQADLLASLAADGARAELHWRQQGTTVYYTGGDEPLVTTLPVVEADASLAPQAGGLRFSIQGQEGLQLSGQARMLGPPGVDAPLEAQLTGGLPDIAPLVPLLAGDVDMSEVTGRVTLDVQASGSLRAPRLAGAARLRDGTVALPDLGVKLEAIELALLGDGSETLRIDGSAMAGGRLGIDGELQPLAAGGPRGWLRVRGERVDAVRLPDRHVQVSPELRLDFAPGSLAGSGRIVIPQAEIVVRELPQSAVSPSRDAVVRDRPPRADASAIGTVIGGEIEIELGRKVHIEGFGLDTLVEGTLKVSQAPDGTPRGFGVLHLKEGRFGAYGKELVIERGTLGFSGPLDDPAVDIRASRRVDYEGRSVTAGIQLSGTASRPQSQVFSDPAMSQADAISYLIAGHPMQGGSQNDQSAVAGAALALGIQQTSPLTQAIGSAVTLDELGVEGGALNEAQVVAGKQLGSDLYLRFSYGLFNQIGTVMARYRLNRHLSIEASSGEDQSLDLVYSVERD